MYFVIIIAILTFVTVLHEAYSCSRLIRRARKSIGLVQGALLVLEEIV